MPQLDTLILLAPGLYSAIPAASAVTKGALYPATDRGIIYRSDLSTWTAWGTYDVANNIAYVGYLTLAEVAAPGTPASGFARLYVKSDGLLYWKDDGGTERAVGTGAGTVTSVTASGSLSSSGGATPDISHDDTAVAPGTYPKVTVDQEGHVTAGAVLAVTDIPAGIDRLLFTGTANAGPDNTTTPTSLVPASGVGAIFSGGVLTLPANTLAAGMGIKLSLSGKWRTNDPANTLQVQVLVNGTAQADTTALGTFASDTVSDMHWTLEYTFDCRTAGGAGTVFGQGYLDLMPVTVVNGPLYPNRMALFNTGTDAIDTTATRTLDVQATWGTANTNNEFICTNFKVWLTNPA